MFSTQSIARISVRRPWATIATWFVVLLLALALIGTTLGDALSTDAGLTSEPESREGQRLIRERFASTGPTFATERVLITSESLTVDQPAFETFVASLESALEEGIGAGFASANSYFDERLDSLASPDGRTAVLTVTMQSNDFVPYREFTRALGRFITADADLDETEAYRRGRMGGTVDGFEIHNVRIPAGGGGDVIIVRSEALTADSAEFKKFVSDLYLDIVRLGRDTVWAFRAGFHVNEESLVSADAHAVVLPIQANDSELWDDVIDVTREASEDPRFVVSVTGGTTLDNDFIELSERDLRDGELKWGLPMAVLVLLVVSGSLVAASVPLAMAILSIIIALGIAALVGLVREQSIFLVNMVFMMGLAVGIDYSLFVVARFRESRSEGHTVSDAVIRSGATAGRAVLISGTTVVFALVGMLLVPHDIFISLGTGAIIVVMVSIAASLSLLPATLMLLGDRVNSIRIPLVFELASSGSAGKTQFWRRISDGVMARPLVALVLGGGMLLALAAPLVNMTLGESGVSTFPEELESRRGFEALQQDFPAGLVSPARIVIDGDATDEGVIGGIETLLAKLGADDSFGPASSDTAPDGSLTVINVPVFGGEYQSAAAIRAIERLRDDIVPSAFFGVSAKVFVAGDTALIIDGNEQMDASMRVVFPFVLVVSFILLMLVFRSLVIPVKAIIMNLLSVGAAYGLIVLVFNEGYGNEIFGFRQVETIEWWIPLFLFAVLFGLSMDYHVFLLSRIREHFNETADNTESVAFGLQSTGRLITGAALIMVAVFSGFAAGSLVMFQQMGFGLAAAVLIDATLIRSVLVPASMKLLGEKNWYFPSRLSWLPDLSELASSKDAS